MGNTSENVIDWDLGKQLAGGKLDLAKEMISMLSHELPETRQAITESYRGNDHKTLLHLVHKLYGGTCYCGVPRLKAAAGAFETSLKKSTDFNEESEQLFNNLIQEMDNVMMAAQHEGIVVSH